MSPHDAIPQDRRTLGGRLQAEYGYGQSASTYQMGVWMLAPARVLAWTDLTADATRFIFDRGVD